MKKILLVVVLLLVMTSVCSAGDRWRPAASSDLAYCYFDTATIKISKELTGLDVWVKFVYTDAARVKMTKYNMDSSITYSVDHMIIDTLNRKTKTLSSTYYNDAGLVKSDERIKAWSDIVPGSTMEDIFFASSQWTLDNFDIVNRR